MLYRYNFFSHYTLQGGEVDIIGIEQKLQISWIPLLGEFLNYLVHNVFVTTEHFKQFSLSENIVQLLLTYKVIVPVDPYKSWIESHYIHKLSANPNKLDKDIPEEAVDVLYKQAPYRLSSIINREVFLTSTDVLFNDIEGNADIAGCFSQYQFGSTRKNHTSDTLDTNYLLSCLKSINKKYKPMITVALSSSHSSLPTLIYHL